MKRLLKGVLLSVYALISNVEAQSLCCDWKCRCLKLVNDPGIVLANIPTTGVTYKSIKPEFRPTLEPLCDVEYTISNCDNSVSIADNFDPSKEDKIKFSSPTVGN